MSSAAGAIWPWLKADLKMPVKKVVIEKANRIYQLPPPLFTSRPPKRDKTLLKKTDILNFSAFEWDVEAESDIILKSDSLKRASKAKLELLKSELARWFEKFNGARLDPEKEIFIGGGVRNLILNIGLTFIDRGELVFVPELGYPHYKRVVAACGGDDVSYAVSAKSDWLPDFSTLSSSIGRIARLLFLNSPHNPTGAVLSEKDFAKLFLAASKENVMIVNDATYQSLSDSRAVSMLSVKGAEKVGVELHSFSHTFGLPSLPFGFAAGHSEVINGLEQISNLSPEPALNFYCDLALEAIRKFPSPVLKSVNRKISDSRAEALKLFDLVELEPKGHNTAPFLWGKIEGRRSSSIAAKILYHAGKIVAVPGTEFGEGGEGYLRFSLTATQETYDKAIQRIKKRRRLFKLIEE